MTKGISTEWYDGDRCVIRLHLARHDVDMDIALLVFDFDRFCWVLTSSDGSYTFDIEIETELESAFRAERQAMAATESGIRDVLLAELKGRATAYRDDTRDMAELGAKVKLRSKQKEDPMAFRSGPPQQGTPDV